MITYRPFAIADGTACRDLMLRCVDDFTGIEGRSGHAAVQRRIARQSHGEELSGMFCIVAEAGEHVVGMGALDGNEVARLYVSPDHRGQGIARHIVGLLEEEAQHREVLHLELDSSMNAVEFYERMGYRRLHRKRWTLERATITNVVMAKDLPPS
jgi:GNAT superfamily N-acetyltransferase